MILKLSNPYININTTLIKHLCWWMVSWNVAIKFIPIFVPFHWIKRFTVHVEVAFKSDCVVSDHVIWYSHFSQPEWFRWFCLNREKKILRNANVFAGIGKEEIVKISSALYTKILFMKLRSVEIWNKNWETRNISAIFIMESFQL